MAAAAMVMLILGTILWLNPGDSPPSISISLLGYTNRVGPYALLAITNSSASEVTLHSTCLVKYSPTPGSAPRRMTSIDANTFRVTRLPPGKGFTQEVFVFPADPGEWQFECSAAHSSWWLEARGFVEKQLRKHFRRVRFPLTSKAWQKFTTDWRTCPP